MMDLTIDHIGYLTDSLVNTKSVFESLGYVGGPIVADEIQRCHICFLEAPRNLRIELVEPYEDNRSMQRLLKKQGCGPYHMCYIVRDINVAYQKLLEQDFIPLFQPVDAAAFNGRRICYFFKQETGYIELVEAEICNKIESGNKEY